MGSPRPIFFFTDFGWSGPYAGQLAAAVLSVDPAIPIVHLMHDAPSMRPDLAAYLLRGCCRSLPDGAIVVAVVDPGVGGERDALQVEANGLTLIGPDNGLLARVDDIEAVHRLDWRPAALSSSFHGRDLFAPAAARLAGGNVIQFTTLPRTQMVGADWPADTAKIIYIDAFGNAMTGVDAGNVSKNSRVSIAGRSLAYAETFCRAATGQPFWFANSQGLVELAANGTSVVKQLSLVLGGNFLLD